MTECNCDQSLALKAKLATTEAKMKAYAKQWITANCCDGEDRTESGNADTHSYNSPELYELVEEIIEDMFHG